MNVPVLHLPTDDRVVRLPDFLDRAKAAARAGVAIHARAPGAGGRVILEIAERLRDAVTPLGAMVFVNDRADAACLANLSLHLPARGLPTGAARAIVGEEVLVGRSTHSPAEALEAWNTGVDYVFLGPIWHTASHPDRPPLGPEAISEAKEARVIAIGGITPARARICRDAGAFGIAVLSAVWDAEDPGSVVGELVLSLEGKQGQ